MKIILTMEEVKRILLDATAGRIAPTNTFAKPTDVHFIGSTSGDDQTIDRVEIGPL